MNAFFLLCSLLLSLPLAALGIPAGTSTDQPKPRLHLVGDSTMADKTNLAYPERGWGQLLREFLRPELTLINHAANGRSTLRFLNEGRWQLLLSDLGKDDYVLIQFAHNDSKQDDPARYAAPDSTYPQLLTRFIRDVRAKGGIPMLATSICRRNFNARGQLQDDLALYAKAMRQVATQEQVELVDLHSWHCAELQKSGPAGSQPYFIQVPAGLYQKFPDGKTDNTHLSVQGATLVAQQFVRQLKQRQHPLAPYVWRELL
ncbi:rhamnogalacturonan acetylesterase [Rheinheimera sp.]|uniref:rhamnogalacturonan acetylesterase n=1 Tax=Rheinheimera sp. TaxID=1869214 RepID=UPI00307FBAFE